jgi:hypothetical protein
MSFTVFTTDTRIIAQSRSSRAILNELRDFDRVDRFVVDRRGSKGEEALGPWPPPGFQKCLISLYILFDILFCMKKTYYDINM